MTTHPHPGQAVWVLWLSARMQVQEMRRNHLGIVIGVVQPVVFLVLVLRSLGSPDPTAATRLSIAVVLTSLWASTVWISGSILGTERRAGTLARLVTGVRPGSLLLLGKSLGATARSLAVILLAVAGSLLVTGTPVRVADPAQLVVGLLVATASGTALGMLMSCLMLLTRFGSDIASALMYPVFIVGGLLVPVEVLPGWVLPLSGVISFSWAQRYLAGAAAGEARLLDLALLALLTLVYAAIALLLFSRIADRARVAGTLDLV